MSQEMRKPLTLADILHADEGSAWGQDELIPLELPIEELAEIAVKNGCDTYWSKWNADDALMIRRKREVFLHFPVFHLGDEGRKVAYIAHEFLPSFKQVFLNQEGAVG